MISKLVKKADFQGYKVNFTFDTKDSHTSVIGGVLTLFMIIVFIVIFILFGQDFFYKLNPKVISALIDNGTYERFKAKNSNFTIAFRLENFDNVRLDKDEIYFYYNIVLNKFERNQNKELALTHEIKFNYSLCKEDDVNNEYYREKNLNDFYCLDLSLLEDNSYDFGGFIDGDFASLLSFDLLKCNEGEFNHKGLPCGSSANQLNLVSSSIFSSLMVINAIVDVNDYITPIKRNIKNISFGVDIFIIKTLEVIFQNVMVESDDGWILQNKATKSALTYSSHNFDNSFVDSLSNDSYYKNVLFSYFIHTESQYTKYLRNYMRIQDLLANVGGILKVLTTVGFSISYLINKINFNVEILSYLNKTEEDKLNDISQLNYQSPLVKNVKKIEDQSLNKLKDICLMKEKKEVKKNNFVNEKLQSNQINEDKNHNICLFSIIKDKIKLEVKDHLLIKKRESKEMRIRLIDYFRYYLCDSKSMFKLSILSKRYRSIIDLKTIHKNQTNQSLLINLLFNSEEKKIFE